MIPTPSIQEYGFGKRARNPARVHSQQPVTTAGAVKQTVETKSKSRWNKVLDENNYMFPNLSKSLSTAVETSVHLARLEGGRSPGTRGLEIQEEQAGQPAASQPTHSVHSTHKATPGDLTALHPGSTDGGLETPAQNLPGISSPILLLDGSMPILDSLTSIPQVIQAEGTPVNASGNGMDVLAITRESRFRDGSNGLDAASSLASGFEAVSDISRRPKTFNLPYGQAGGQPDHLASAHQEFSPQGGAKRSRSDLPGDEESSTRGFKRSRPIHSTDRDEEHSGTDIPGSGGDEGETHVHLPADQPGFEPSVQQPASSAEPPSSVIRNLQTELKKARQGALYWKEQFEKSGKARMDENRRHAMKVDRLDSWISDLEAQL